ncbi:Na+/H+ antiporter-like protein [Heterostelium album PN500]|uniref:Na+/H+ antiporter-like protein n=1 Tax=Heterostelium pallidum (strain ATCC 26659 / Pp 5 / PN500) TaxID=670386 RepID=D3BMX2_HETP5|nr:Na+/H+ antiporter-like protein [Heterostelium album PN500]EFA77334.1 Na+/H+ antiporter-like protein [Heterostelium album PN500]|eukprot:XP_020429463.1 Na+/H+ antiporter-like protein [Heterostelium album PN500]
MVQNVLSTDVALFLVQCLLIIILSRCVAWLFAKIQQPPVIAEIISGILLGPTALGKIPNFTSTLFPKASVSILYVFAQIGLIFFMFIIGLELDPTLFRSQIRQSLAISTVSIVFPFGLGLAASVYLAHIQDTAWTYSLGIFIGVALCITAFPVLARILASKKLLSTPIGILTIACAAINDICGWVLLGLSVSLAGSSNSLDTVWTLLASIGFVAVMLLVVRPILHKVTAMVYHVDPHADTTHPQSPSHLVMSGVVIVLFTASWATEVIGIHAMFGAFTLGAITPKTGGFNQAITEKIEDLVLVFLLPLYFVISGLRTDLTTLNTGESWIGVVVIISCACIGKIVGSGLVALLLGNNKRDSLSIGILMNTRGLVELIVLNLGLDFKIINIEVFGIMVLMAVFTTLMTSPLISMVMKKEKKSGSNDDFTVVLCTPSLNMGPALVDLGYTIGNKTVSTLRRKKMKKIYLLSVSEVNDRPSDFIGQIRKDISKSTYGHLIQQGIQMKLKVSFNSIVSDSDHLSKEIIHFTDNKNAKLLIVGEDVASMSSGRGGMISQGVQWSLFKNSTSHVGVFTDRSGFKSIPHRFRRVLLAYLGGKNYNDAESLDLANRMAETDGVHVTIVVFDNDFYWKHKQQTTDDFVKLPDSQSKMFDATPTTMLSPDGVDANQTHDPTPAAPTVKFHPQASLNASGSTSLGRTTEMYDPVKLQQYESHLESILNGKNKDKFSVIYKPKKHRQKVLLEMCVQYDLLVVPYEEKKQLNTTSPFTGFQVLPAIEMMKRSLSMVHLTGSRKTSDASHQHPHFEEMDSLDNHPVGDTNSKSSKADKIHSSTNNNNINNNHNDGLQKHADHENNSSSGEALSDLHASHDDVFDQHNPLKVSSDSEPFWHRCPISTLVIYHKDTIPALPSTDEVIEVNESDDVKQVDPPSPLSPSEVSSIPITPIGDTGRNENSLNPDDKPLQS